MLDISHLSAVPRETCIGDPALIRSILLANLAIFASYLFIPAGLMRLLFRCGLRLPRRDMLLFFMAFIIPCGCSHLVMAVVIYQPLYHLEAWSLWVTAAASLLAGAVLWFSVPGLARIVAAYWELRAVVLAQQHPTAALEAG